MTLDFRHVLDGLVDPVIALIDIGQGLPGREPGSIAYANPAAGALLGWEPDSLIGELVTAILPPSARPVPPLSLEDFLAIQVPRLLGQPSRLRALRADGEQVLVEMLLSRVPRTQESPGLLAVVFHDARTGLELERQQRVVRYLHATTNLAARLAGAEDLDTVLRTIVDALLQDLDATAARIWFSSDDAPDPYIAIASDAVHVIPDAPDTKQRILESIRAGEPLVAHERNGDGGGFPEPSQHPEARSYAILPLVTGRGSLGALEYFGRSRLSEGGAAALAACATVVAASLDDVRQLLREREARRESEEANLRLTALARSLDRALTEVGLVNDIVTAAAGEEDLGRMLDGTLRHVARAVPFTGGSIAFREGNEVVVQAAVGPYGSTALGQRTPVKQSQTGARVGSGDSFLANDPRAEGVSPSTDVRSYLAVPLAWRGEVYGFLEIDAVEANAFTTEDLALLSRVARALSGPVELARRYALEVRATALAEAARRRLAFLSEASTLLAASLDLETTLATVAKLAVPALSDWCVVDLLDAEGVIRRLKVAHADPGKAGWARQLEQLTGRLEDPRNVVSRTLRDRASALAPEVDDATLQHAARDREHLSILRALGIQSHMIVPLIARGNAVGALTFVASDSGRRYSRDDLALAEELALRIAVAIDNARLYKEAREAERRSAEAAALLDTSLAQAPIGFAVWDLDRRYVRVNRALGEMYGLEPAAFLGHSTRELLPQVAGEFEAALARVAEGAEPVLDQLISGRGHAAAGPSRHWLASFYPVRVNGTETIAIGALVTDITERRHEEEVRRFLAEAGELLVTSLDYRTTLESVAKLAVPYLADWCSITLLEDNSALVTVPVAHSDPAKVELAHEVLRRYPPGEDSSRAVNRVIRSGRPELVSDIAPELLAAASIDEEHERLLSAVAPVSYICVPLVARGRALGAITFLSAESGRHYGERDLAVALDLARRAALAVDNARLYREAQRAIETRDRFLTIAAHELRTPITTVRGNTELLLRRVQRESVPLDREWLTERLQRLMLGVERLQALAARVLDLNNLQAGLFSLAREEVDLVALTRAVTERQRATIQDRSGTRLEIRHSPQPIRGFWDPLRLEQVLVNLLHNAAKYQPHGGTITIDVEETADDALVRVRDQGIGIARDDLQRLFEPFARADTAVMHQISGMGLGLYISSQLVRLHGGELTVESTVGEGSEFTIRLPKRIDADASAEQAPVSG